MKKVKLSDFKPYQKMVFVDGELKTEKNKINGEINFIQLNKKNIKNIYENGISKIEESDNEMTVVYKVIGLITDIENDITLEEFEEIIETPSQQITSLTEGIIEYLNTIIDISEKNTILQEKSDIMNNKIANKKGK